MASLRCDECEALTTNLCPSCAKIPLCAKCFDNSGPCSVCVGLDDEDEDEDDEDASDESDEDGNDDEDDEEDED